MGSRSATTATVDATADEPPTSRRPPTRLVAVALVALVVAGIVLWRVLGDQPQAPYDDPRAGGLLTLCSTDGDAVTEGEVTDRPFAAVVTGSSGLAADADPAGAVATLFAYQPRQGVAPDEYSGTPITAAQALVDTARPVVVVTEDSWSVGDFTTAFPATYDGYVQLRLYLGTPEAGTLTESTYDTADLRVDGGHWELVHGGTASCADASASAPRP